MKTVFDDKLFIVDSTGTMYEIFFRGRTRGQIKREITKVILRLVNRTVDRLEINGTVLFRDAEDFDAGMNKLAELDYWSDPEA